MIQIVNRMKKTHLSAALKGWHEYVRDLRNVNKKVQHKELALMIINFQLTHQLLVSALLTWHLNILKIFHQRVTFERLVYRFRNARISAAFEMWWVNVQETAKQLDRLTLSTQRTTHRVISSAFER